MSVLNATLRDAAAKPKRLRNDGFVPLALLQPGSPSMLLQAKVADLKHAISHVRGAGILDIMIEGEKAKRHVMLKGVDQDPVARAILSVTFMQVSEKDKVKADLPIASVGTPHPVAEGFGVLVHPTNAVTIRGRVSDIPDHLEVDISAMQVGESIHAGDVKLADGLELLSSADAILFSLQQARNLMADIEAEQAAEAAAAEESAAADLEAERTEEPTAE